VFPSPKTVRLSAGRHPSPDDGVCVLELCSMLAEEPFSDHPDSVCPVIGAFLRGVNDHLPAQERQRLYGLAQLVVESRSTVPWVVPARTAVCLDAAGAAPGGSLVEVELAGAQVARGPHAAERVERIVRTLLEVAPPATDASPPARVPAEAIAA